MITNINRNSAEIMKIFETRIATYIDYNGNKSIMKWIPPFTACRALTSTAAVATPSGTVGDWFHPSLINPAWTEGTDYEICGKRKVLTSGTLTVGYHYRIKSYASGDDFSNVGCPQNATGQCFIATDTTPTTWTNGSVLVENEMGGFWVDMYLCSSYDATGQHGNSGKWDKRRLRIPARSSPESKRDHHPL